MKCTKCLQIISNESIYCCYCGKKQIKTKQRRSKRGNGTGSVYIPTGRKTWTAQIQRQTISGRKIYRKGGFATKKEALEYLPALKNEIYRPKCKSPTLVELFLTFKATKYPSMTTKIKRQYDLAFKRLEKISDVSIDNLTIMDLQNSINNYTRFQAKNIVTLLRSLYRLAIAQGIPVQCLPDYIVLPEQECRETRPFSENDIANMWRGFDLGVPHVEWLLIMCYTGMMPAELRSLNISMIDWDERTIYGCGAKTNVRRNKPIVFPEFLIPVLQRLADQANESGNVINKGSDTAFYKRYYQAIDDCGCSRRGPYSCRHTFATELAKRDVSPERLKEAMRHATSATTERYYLHPDPSFARDAVDKLVTHR